MDIEFLNNFKATLLQMLSECKSDANRVSPKPVVQAIYNTKIELLERLVIFTSNAIKEGVVDMEKIKAEIKVIGEVDIEDVKGGSRANSPVTSKIIEIAEKLQEGKGAIIDAGGIEWGHFSTRVHTMRNEGRVAANIYPGTKDGQFYIFKYTPEQMKKYPQKRKPKASSN